MMNTALHTRTNTLPLPGLAPSAAVHDTAFFRDSATFDTIRDLILPEVIARNAPHRCLRIWSVGCSTGQEPYSLAMLLCEHFPELTTWDVQILATDISSTALGYAAQARYKRMDVNRGLPARLLLKYFERSGEEWHLDSRVRQMCRFQQMDLCTLPPFFPRFDVILLRNVLLYLPALLRSRAVRGARAHLRDDGFLVLGAAEQAEDSTDLFVPDFAPQFSFYRPLPRT